MGTYGASWDEYTTLKIVANEEKKSVHFIIQIRTFKIHELLKNTFYNLVILKWKIICEIDI